MLVQAHKAGPPRTTDWHIARLLRDETHAEQGNGLALVVLNQRHLEAKEALQALWRKG